MSEYASGTFTIMHNGTVRKPQAHKSSSSSKVIWRREALEVSVGSFFSKDVPC